MSVDQKTGGDKNTEVHRKMQVDGRDAGNQTEASQWTQTDRMAQVDVVMQGSESEVGQEFPGGCDGTRKGGDTGSREDPGRRPGAARQGDTVRGSMPSATKVLTEGVPQAVSPHSRAPNAHLWEV